MKGPSVTAQISAQVPAKSTLLAALPPKSTEKDSSGKSMTLRVILEMSKKKSPRGQLTKTTATFKGVESSVAMDMQLCFEVDKHDELTDLQHRLQSDFKTFHDKENRVLELVVVARDSCNFASAELAFKLLSHWTKSCVRGPKVDFIE